ncbi:MAG: class I SAM-dependent methyltransferase [Nanoarchaeota archaeon]
MNKNKDYQLKYYEKDHAYLDYQDTHFVNHVVDHTIKKAGLMKRDKILEIGAGSGRFTIPLLKKRFHITALELSKHMAERLKKAARPYLGRLSVVNKDLFSVSKKWDKEFDVILGFHILHHIDDLKSCFQSLHCMLKPEGQLIFTEPNILNPLYYVQLLVEKDMTWQGEKGYVNLRKMYLKKLMQKAGFKNIRFTRYGVLPSFLANNRLGAWIEPKLEKLPFPPMKLYLCIQAQK